LVRVLDQGFFSHGFHRLDDGLDRVEVCCGHILRGCMPFLYLLLGPSASSRHKIHNMIKKKKKEEKKTWDLGHEPSALPTNHLPYTATNHLPYTAGDHEPSPLHSRRLKTQHHENSSSTSTNTALSVCCTRTLSELHPPTSRLTSLIMFLGPGVLVSWGRLALLHPLSARVSLPRLALARSATPSRPCYRPLGLQFAVGENSSTGYGLFLRSLRSR